MKGNIINGSLLLAGRAKLPEHLHDGLVLVGGCFDIVHFGHVTFLNKARAQGNHLIVALENDQFIEKRKHTQPFHSQKQRAEFLINLRAVDAVITLPTMTSHEDYRTLVQQVKPTCIAVTKEDPQILHKRIYAKEVGGKVVAVSDLLKGFSSSTIRTYAHIMRD